ncbi:MAG TPA: T9SS type A sorting domain-containing protein, partial [Saprospiraceae bacterium]|nr:T9SS type A sorting domain-containing protein [Saprospiraceae bacterium]
NPTFNYKVPNIAGVYNYKCTPHGFTGSFTVTCSVNTNEENQLKSSFLYPSPFSSKVTLQYENADEVRIISITGITLKTIPLNIAETQVVFYLDDLNPGFYFYSILKEGVIRETKKIIRIN